MSDTNDKSGTNGMPEPAEETNNDLQDMPDVNEISDADNTEISVTEDASSENTGDTGANTEDETTEVEVSDAEEEEEELITYVPKLTPEQQNIWQTVLGLALGIVMWVLIGLPLIIGEDGGLLGWLWVILFGIIIFSRRGIENKTGVSLQRFMRFFLIGLIIGLAIFIIYGVSAGLFTAEANNCAGSTETPAQ